MRPTAAIALPLRGDDGASALKPMTPASRRSPTPAANASRAAAALFASAAPRPHQRRPFVFYHLRKCGGSTTRTQLVAACRRRALRHWMPCFDDVACDTYTAPEGHQFWDGDWPAVLGGHLARASVERAFLAQVRPRGGARRPRRATASSCASR